MTIDPDQRDAAKLIDAAKGGELLSTDYLESRTSSDRMRQTPVNKSKTADTTRVSTVTIAMDPDLVTYAEANSRWLVRGMISILGESTNGDCDFTLLGPTGSAGFFKVDASTAKNNAGPAGTHTEVTQATDTTAVARAIEGIVTVGSTAGNIGLGWAQNASHVDDVIVQAGSFLTFMRMENS